MRNDKHMIPPVFWDQICLIKASYQLRILANYLLVYRFPMEIIQAFVDFLVLDFLVLDFLVLDFDSILDVLIIQV